MSSRSRSSSENSDCAICLEPKNRDIAVLSCGHTYHYKCVEEWINKKKNMSRCCCICEKTTEIVNIVGIDNNLENIPLYDNDNLLQQRDYQITYNNNYIPNTYQNYDTDYFPYYSNTQRNQVVPENYNLERRQPSFFDLFCCTIL